MKLCKSFIFVFTAIYFMNQGFAVDYVKRHNDLRQEEYNKSPINLRIPIYTGKLNKVFENTPTKIQATPDERKDILKTVMGTALIHGDNMSFRRNRVDNGSSDLFKHFEILRMTQELSQILAAQIDTLSFENDESFDKIEETVTNTVNQYQYFKDLSDYSGVNKDIFSDWFVDVYLKHLEGLSNSYGKHWKDPEAYKKLAVSNSNDDYVFSDYNAIKQNLNDRYSNSSSNSVIYDDDNDEELKKVLAASLNQFSSDIEYVDNNKKTHKLELYPVVGDGSCGFYAIGKSREEVANAVEQYFNSDTPISGDSEFIDRIKVDFEEEYHLNDNELSVLFLPRTEQNKVLKNQTIEKIKKNILDRKKYASIALLGLAAKVFNINLRIYVNDNGEAVLRERCIGYATNTVCIINNGKSGINAHYDLLVDPRQLNAADERARGEALEQKTLFGKNLDRSNKVRVPLNAQHPLPSTKENSSYAERELLANIGENNQDSTMLAYDGFSFIDLFNGFFENIKRGGPIIAINSLFGDSFFNEQNYGKMSKLAFLLAELDWIQEHKNDNIKAGFLGMQRGHPYNFSHKERGNLIIHERSINQFIIDAHKAFEQGYVSYSGIICNNSPNLLASSHYYVLFVTKNASNRISQAYVLNPTGGSHTDQDSEKETLEPLKEVLSKQDVNVNVSNNGFLTGLQSGNLACGLASSMIAKYFSTFSLDKINTRDKVIEELKTLQRQYGYSDRQLNSATNLYESTKLSRKEQDEKDILLLVEEKKFGDRMLAIGEELCALTKSGEDLLSKQDLSRVIHDWIHQKRDSNFVEAARMHQPNNNHPSNNNRQLSNGLYKDVFKETNSSAASASASIPEKQYKFIDAKGNISGGGSKGTTIEMVITEYFSHSDLERALRYVYPTPEAPRNFALDSEIKAKLAEMGILG